jgi:coenzyme Q-binding protein COQ10
VTIATISVRKRLPFRAADLHGLVCDVRAYPRFIPWVKSLTLRIEREDGAGFTGVASALVGWKAFMERFETRVVSDPANGKITVTLVSGPFRHLQNSWRFEDEPVGGAMVAFLIHYQFKNPILQALAGANRDYAGARIMAAFEAEAHRRFPLVGTSGPA